MNPALLLLTALLLAPLAAPQAAEQVEPAGKPNVLLIVAHDLGYGDVSVHGCKVFNTPHLDSIAKAGGASRAATWPCRSDHTAAPGATSN